MNLIINKYYLFIILNLSIALMQCDYDYGDINNDSFLDILVLPVISTKIAWILFIFSFHEVIINDPAMSSDMILCIVFIPFLSH